MRGNGLQGVLVEAGKEFPLGIGCFLMKKSVVQAHLGRYGVFGADPMDGALHLSAIGRIAAARLGIIGAVKADDVALLILL